MIHFKCQGCQQELAVPVELAGVSGPCPYCRTVITSPTLEERQPKIEATPLPPVQTAAESQSSLPVSQDPSPASQLGSSLPSKPQNDSTQAKVQEQSIDRPRPQWGELGNSNGGELGRIKGGESGRGTGKLASLIYALSALVIVGVCAIFFYSDQIREFLITHFESQRTEEKETFEERLKYKNDLEDLAPKPTPMEPKVDPKVSEVKEAPVEVTLAAKPLTETPKPPSDTMPAGGSAVKNEVVEVTIPRGEVNAPQSEIIVEASPEVADAVETIKKFCAAPTWEERAKFVQFEKEVRPMMNRFYEANTYESVKLSYIRLMYHEVSKEGDGKPHAVFHISGAGLNKPVPIMAEQHADGWKIDWLAFTEFSEELLERFMNDYVDSPTRFRVMIRRKAYFGDEKLRGKDSFEITPPVPGFEAYVFTEKDAEISKELNQTLPWNRPALAVIAELKWRREGELKWVELVSLPQLNWKNNGPDIPKAEKIE